MDCKELSRLIVDLCTLKFIEETVQINGGNKEDFHDLFRFLKILVSNGCPLSAFFKSLDDYANGEKNA